MIYQCICYDVHGLWIVMSFDHMPARAELPEWCCRVDIAIPK